MTKFRLTMPRVPSAYINTAPRNPSATTPSETDSMPIETTEMEVRPFRLRLTMPKVPSSYIEKETKPCRLRLTMPKAPSSYSNTATTNPSAAACSEPRPMPIATTGNNRYQVFDDDPVPFYLPPLLQWTKKEPTAEPTLLEPQKSNSREASNKGTNGTSKSPEPTKKAASTAKNVVKRKTLDTNADAIATPTTEEKKDESDMLASAAESLLHFARGTKRKASGSTVDATAPSTSTSAPKKIKVTGAQQPKSRQPKATEEDRYLRSYAPSPSPNLPVVSNGREAARVIRAGAPSPSPRPASSNIPQENERAARLTAPSPSPDTVISNYRLRNRSTGASTPPSSLPERDTAASSSMEGTDTASMQTSAGAQSQSVDSHQSCHLLVRDDVPTENAGIEMSVEWPTIMAAENGDVSDEQLRAYGRSVADFWAATLGAMDGDGDAA